MPRWSIVWSRIAFFMTALVASLDEWHHSFLPSRTGNVHDILLDSTAALGAQVLLYLALRGWRKARIVVSKDQPLYRSAEEPIEQPTSRR
jgi:VanZ family protein